MAHRVALLFPGQASQFIGMGSLAAMRFVAAREIFAHVDAALGEPISQICFEGPAERLQETRWQQPAIFACSLALYFAWRARLGDADQPIASAGHSLGEYSALVAAGALSLEDGARLVALRGRLMQEAADREQGGMVAVLGLDREIVAGICDAVTQPALGLDQVVVLANDNAPGQQVISGGSAAIERAVAEARARGARRIVPLKVAGAFHSPLMASAVSPLADAIATTPITECRFPVVANSSCELLYTPEAVRAELIRQMTAPVRWVENMEVLANLEPSLWIDSGPGSVVANLAGRIMPDLAPLSLSALLDAPDPG